MESEMEQSQPGAWSKALAATVNPIQKLSSTLSTTNIMQAGFSMANRGRVDSFGKTIVSKDGVEDTVESDAARPGQVSGLKWRNVGGTQPEPGEKLDERMLTEALGNGFTTFTQEEWDKFGIRDLRMEHYVHAHGSYFVPAAMYSAVPVGLTSKTRWRTTPQSAAPSAPDTTTANQSPTDLTESTPWA